MNEATKLLLETPEFLTYDAGFTDGWNACVEREFQASHGFNAPELPHKTFCAMIRKFYKKWLRDVKKGVTVDPNSASH